LAVDYPLAPENYLPDTIEKVAQLYENLISIEKISPKKIIFMGDSAGGGFSLLLLQALKRNGSPQPNAAVLMSPFTDLSATAKSYETNKHVDVMVTKETLVYCGTLITNGKEEDLTSERFSPIYGSFEGLPPMKFFVGGSEILLDDTLVVAQKAKESGVQVDLVLAPYLIHVYPCFYNLFPEAMDGFRQIDEYIRKRLDQ